jgi:bacterioferritin
MKHAEKLIERLLFLDSTPKMEYLELNIGGDVKAQLTADYKLEVAAVEMYNKAVAIARENNDDASRELFALLLKDEEEHVEWLEAQLHQIKELGYETYLSNLTEGKEG